jgi:hypothetical protein
MQINNSKLYKRTLLYLASGGYCIEYESLPYQKVILVDKAKEFTSVNLPFNSKVELWNLDALDAINEISQRGLIIDCVVSINEGLLEGGGDYVIFSDFLMGYLSPFLADNLILIADLSYYNSIKIKSHIAKFDWGFEKIKCLLTNDENYINPIIFSNKLRNIRVPQTCNYGQVFYLKRNYSIINKKIGSIHIRLIHGSIWKDSKQLDSIGVSFPLSIESSTRAINPNVLDFFNKIPNTFQLNNLSIIEIIQMCKNKNWRRVGLMPWKKGDYKQVFKDLLNFRENEIIELSFYHLNKSDYQDLYENFGEYFLIRFPMFFQYLKKDNLLWISFENVLNRGYGSFLLKLSEEILKNKKKENQSFCFISIKIVSNKLKIQSNSNDLYINGLIRMVELICI